MRSALAHGSNTHPPTHPPTNPATRKHIEATSSALLPKQRTPRQLQLVLLLVLALLVVLQGSWDEMVEEPKVGKPSSASSMGVPCLETSLLLHRLADAAVLLILLLPLLQLVPSAAPSAMFACCFELWQRDQLQLQSRLRELGLVAPAAIRETRDSSSSCPTWEAEAASRLKQMTHET